MRTPVAKQNCPRCEQSIKLRERTFSDQAMSALLSWGELNHELVGQAICDDCYNELREVLIDRAGELETTDYGGKIQKKPGSGKQAS